MAALRMGVLALALGLAAAFKGDKHHNYAATEAVIDEVVEKCPSIASKYSVGESVEGRELWVLEFASPPGRNGLPAPHTPLKPEFKYVGNMHGNEVVGKEMILHLADHLCAQWNAGNATVRDLIANAHIHLMPTMNPDGYEKAYNAMGDADKENAWLEGRSNANGKDLNRDFPDLDTPFFELRKAGVNVFDHLLELADTEKERQPETVAVSNWILSRPFVLSANLHEGDLVANYPFDLSDSGVSKYTKTVDDVTFRDLALSYSLNHASMADPSRPSCDMSPHDQFAKHGGITNGARWYSVKGGMQDFNYLATNCFEVTLELSCEKFPAASRLPSYWADNRRSLVAFMQRVHMGVKGLIRDEEGAPVGDAAVWVKNATDAAEPNVIRHSVHSTADGDYFRLLPAGDYEVLVEKDGFEPTIKTLTVPEGAQTSAVLLDFVLPYAKEAEEELLQDPEVEYYVQ